LQGANRAADRRRLRQGPRRLVQEAARRAEATPASASDPDVGATAGLQADFDGAVSNSWRPNERRGNGADFQLDLAPKFVMPGLVPGHLDSRAAALTHESRWPGQA